MKRILNNLLFLFVISLIIFEMNFKAIALDKVDWILLKENKDGKEWIDLGSIKRLNNSELSVLTKYYENPNKVRATGKTNLYVMRINCDNNYFKDISINGISNLNSKWMSSNNDELIDIVIERSCSEEFLK